MSHDDIGGRNVHLPHDIENRISWGDILQTVAIVLTVGSAVWYGSGKIEELSVVQGADHTEIKVLRETTNALKDLIVATDNLAKISTTRIDNLADRSSESAKQFAKQLEVIGDIRTDVATIKALQSKEGMKP